MEELLLVFAIAVDVALILKLRNKIKECRHYWAQVQSVEFHSDVYIAASRELPEVIYDKDGREYHKSYGMLGEVSYFSEEDINSCSENEQ
ncbi:MAG: hypothetical protein LIO53_01980 [Oscillospiraceae bacterium]|nr:hypothetical protein [Oscillospiraceae bacterium]